MEALGLFEQRYSVLSGITSIVVGFCVLIFIMLFIHKRIFLEVIHFLVNPYYEVLMYLMIQSHTTVV